MQQSFRDTLKEVFQLFLQVDKEHAISDALIKIKGLYKADRIQLILLNEENATLHFMEEIAPTPEQRLSAFLNSPFQKTGLYFQKELSWLLRHIKKGKDIYISNTDELSWEASSEKSIWEASGITSSACVHFSVKGENRGFIEIDFFDRHVEFDETEKENLRFLADAFSLYMEKTEAYKEIDKISVNLSQSNTIFQAMFDTIQVGIELYDNKGYLININPFGQEMLETTKEGVLGVNIFDNPNLTEEQIEKIREGLNVTLENDFDFYAVNETEYFITNRKEGVIRIIAKCIPLRDTKGDIFAYLLLSTQDQGYYMEKEALRINLEKLRLAVNTQDAFFWEYDVQKDAVTIDYDLFDPRRKEHILSVRRMNMINKISHLQHIHPEDVGRVLQQLNYMIDGELDFFTETYKYYNEDEYRWFTTSFSTYKYDNNKKPETIVCLTTDITEQRKNEIELIKAKEANKIKTAFIENMSHEIRTPMNVIVGFSSILAENNNTAENQYLIDLIQRNNEILLRLIDSLLNFTELESETMKYNYEIVDIKQLCQAALNIKSTNRKPEIKFHLKEELPSIMLQTDKDRLLQVMYQFMDNANKYTHEGEVSLSYHLTDDCEVRFEITDTGIGMTKEEIGKIFSHFYKTDPFQIGVGLGLSIARKIIEDMEGKIGVESTKGKGSTFWFTLPLAANNKQKLNR